MTSAAFHLPVWFDLGATFAFALTGALSAIKRGYDIVGIFFLALASGIGGGLIRDGVFIPGGAATPLLTDPRYIELIAVATVAGALFGDGLGWSRSRFISGATRRSISPLPGMRRISAILKSIRIWR